MGKKKPRNNFSVTDDAGSTAASFSDSRELQTTEDTVLGARIKEVSEKRLRLRSCLFCEGRISVLKRWFKTPIQNAVHGSTVYASLEKKTISWACTAHCSRLLFELKWTGKAFIWRHLNVVICDFAFMLPPESAFCSNHDRKRTFLGVLNQRFETTFIRK